MKFILSKFGEYYLALVNAMQGKTHFMLAVGVTLVTVGFFLKGDSPNYAIFAGIIGASLGLQTWRSVKEDTAQIEAKK